MPISPKAQLQDQAPGAYYHLSLGKVHCQLLGTPQDKPLVVCVHGVSAEGVQFQSLAKDLVADGYQVALPDMYGRGFSDGVDSKHHYDVHLFTTSLAELLLKLIPETQGASTRGIYLVGTSMGGAISIRFTELHPHLVKKLVLCCPAGLPMTMPGAIMFVKAPVIGEMLMSMVGKGSTEKSSANAYHDHQREGAHEHWRRTVDRTMELGKLHPAYSSALLDTVRNFDFGGLESSFEAVGKQETPVLLVWGESDVVVPFSNHVTALKLIPNAKFLSLPECGHVDFFAVPSIMEVYQNEVLSFMNA